MTQESDSAQNAGRSQGPGDSGGPRAGEQRLRRTATLTEAEIEAVRSAVSLTTRVDGVEPIGDGPLRSLVSGEGVRHLLVQDAVGNLLGYANVDAPGTKNAMIEAFVVPEARSSGVGSALLGAAIAEAGSHGRVWAHGGGAAARAVAEHMDMDVRRELLQLSRSLTSPPLPGLEIPSGVTVRTFRDGDEDELLRVNNAAFAWHPEQGGMTRRDLDDERGESWFDPQGLFLAFADDDPATLLGFHWTKVHPAQADDPAVGEVYVVGVDPAAQGRGVGRALTLAGLHHLHSAGLGAVMLYVEGDNTAALKTYELLGFSRSRVDVAYGWSS